MKRITVFCGSSDGQNEIYKSSAYSLGKKLALEKIGVVYGGASIGVMGAVANGSMENGGEVIGVIPVFLSTKEIAHASLSQLIEVETMHERKMKMHELADGFIILPGGIGTLEEFFEILTWAQLGLHKKPIAVYNVNHYYNDLIHFIDHMVQSGFLKPVHKKLILVSEDENDLINQMQNYTAPDLGKFISEEKT